MTKRNFAIIAKGLLVRKNEFTEAHERIKACEKKGAKKRVVMGRGRG